MALSLSPSASLRYSLALFRFHPPLPLVARRAVRHGAIRRAQTVRRDPTREVPDDRQERLQRHQELELGRVVEKVPGARTHRTPQARQHPPGHTLPPLVPSHLCVLPDEPHRQAPLEDRGRVHRPRWEREGVGGLRVDEQRARRGPSESTRTMTMTMTICAGVCSSACLSHTPSPCW